MTINLESPETTDLRPKITVFGVGGAGGNAVNNMIQNGLEGCEFVVANTDAQALSTSQVKRTIQMGVVATEGLGAGSQPEIGRAAAEEALDDIKDELSGSHMVFITAGMGGGTGTGAAPIVAQAAKDLGILTVGVVTKPFNFEGARRMNTAVEGIDTLQSCVDTLIVIPNQNLFRIANDQTTFADAFAMADQVLFSGVASVTDLMVKEGLINLDFADVRAVMRNMGNAMMGTGEASGDSRSKQAAEEAIANPLLDESSMKGARGLLISISGGHDLTLYEVDEAATRIRQEVDPDANVILGATFDETLDGLVRVSVVATGIDRVEEGSVSPDSEMKPDFVSNNLNSANETLEKESDSPGESVHDKIERSLNALGSESTNADPEVTISTYQNPGKDSNFQNSQDSAKDSEPEARKPYIPPPSDDVDGADMQMPSLEDFPPIAQREYNAKVASSQRQDSEVQAGKKAGSEQVDRKSKPRGLLKRLTSGFVRKENELGDAKENPVRKQQIEPVINANSHENSSTEFEIRSDGESQKPSAEVEEKISQSSSIVEPANVNTNIKKTATQSNEEILTEEQLEIPAFLRRQSN